MSTQPTNGVCFFRAMVDTSEVENDEYYNLFLGLLTSMGAGGKYDFRQLDTQIDLYTGGLSASNHVAESTGDLLGVHSRGLLVASHCLERNSAKMFELWADLFNNVFQNKSDDEIRARLVNLVNMSAADSMNGVAYSGHRYAMTHAASKLAGQLPAAATREDEGGLTALRFINGLAATLKGKGDEVDQILARMKTMASKVLRSSNIRSVALNSEPDYRDSFLAQTDKFLGSLEPSSSSSCHADVRRKKDPSVRTTAPKTYVSTNFPVHFCSSAVATVPYEHPDSARLRILARLLSAKFLHAEIREKGGAYGGGATSSPSSGLFTFYSYRDPNCSKTLDVFERARDKVVKGDFSDRDVDEAKLSVFQAVDSPVLPGARGLRLYLSGVTDDLFQEQRMRLKSTTRADLMRVADVYLKAEKFSTTVIGPEATGGELAAGSGSSSDWVVEGLV